jgi:hypothetical protein
MIRHFLTKLKTYKVRYWASDSNDPNQSADRLVADLREADVISSELKDWDSTNQQTRHIVVLDIDYPAALIPSETANHFHLFLDVPGGIPHNEYMGLLKQLARLGVIEPGFADASFRRGHSDVRLPWVSKAETGPNMNLVPASEMVKQSLLSQVLATPQPSLLSTPKPVPTEDLGGLFS